jgi:hypothetical protein
VLIDPLLGRADLTGRVIRLFGRGLEIGATGQPGNEHQEKDAIHRDEAAKGTQAKPPQGEALGCYSENVESFGLTVDIVLPTVASS